MAAPGMSTKRAIVGAVLLDLAVSPLFAWDVFTDSLRRDLGTDDTLLAGVFSVGLLTFMVDVEEVDREHAGGLRAQELPPAVNGALGLTP
jgi:hypothetical protein